MSSSTPSTSVTPSSHPLSSPINVLIQSAKNETEVIEWGKFCATRGFAHRPGAIERFYRKYQNDPTRRLDWVIIGYHDTNSSASTSSTTSTSSSSASTSIPTTDNSITEHSERTLPIIGSVRLFDRVMYTDSSSSIDPSSKSSSNSKIHMIGWGEVCTEPLYRGQGIANKVLSYAVNIMEQYHQQYPNYKVSLLHAAIPVMPLYEKFGYKSILLHHGSIKLLSKLINPIPLPIPLPNNPDSNNNLSIPLLFTPNVSDRKFVVRLAEIPSVANTNSTTKDDVPELLRIHQETIHTLSSFWTSGIIERNEEYWRTWITFAARGHLWVLEEVNTVTNNTRLLGYACAHWRNDTLRLMDIGFSNTTTNKDILYLLETAYIYGWGPERYVAAAALQAANALASSVTGSNPTTTVPLTTTIEPQYLQSTNLIIPHPILLWFDPLFSKELSSSTSSTSDLYIPDLPTELDPGWMVRSLHNDCDRERDCIVKLGEEGKFCIFGLDGF